jgi:regulator of cell morphogenesis and NO signaling
MSMHSRTEFLQQPLADIVTRDARTAAIFDRAALDYCCHGQDTLAQAAARNGIPVEDLLASLEALGPPSQTDAAAADNGDLRVVLDRIVNRHHAYVREITPVVSGWLDKLVGHHGGRHPELGEVREIFARLATAMLTHMEKEEHILFPYIDGLARAAKAGGRASPSPFGTILNPIRVMENDHEDAGAELTRLRALTGGYTPPADACTTYRLCYRELARFEADLHRHVHLENHVLFPRAADLERWLT